MIFTLPGLLISIRKPEFSDLDYLRQLLSLDIYSTNLGGVAGMSGEYYETKAMKILEDNANDQSINKYYLIEERFKKTPIGLSILTQIDWKNRHAEHSYIISDKKYRSKLFAGDINVVMHNYFFYQLNLNKIFGYIFDNNMAAIRMMEFGSKYDGRLRMHRVQRQIATDVHVFSITEAEFADFVQNNSNGILKKHIVRGFIRCSQA